MNRRMIFCGCIVVLTGIMACRVGTVQHTPLPAATIVPAETATTAPTETTAPTDTPAVPPTQIPSLLNYDGEWEGLTQLGLPVSFTVEDNLITHFAAEYEGKECHNRVEPDLPFFGAIENGSFQMSSGMSGLLGFSWSFAGTFSSSSTATGTFKAMLASCGSVNTTWEASRK
jgi:hypothetical protein